RHQAEPGPNSRWHDAASDSRQAEPAPNSRIGMVGNLGFYLAVPSLWGEKIKFSSALKGWRFQKAKPSGDDGDVSHRKTSRLGGFSAMEYQNDRQGRPVIGKGDGCNADFGVSGTQGK